MLSAEKAVEIEIRSGAPSYQTLATRLNLGGTAPARQLVESLGREEEWRRVVRTTLERAVAEAWRDTRIAADFGVKRQAVAFLLRRYGLEEQWRAARKASKPKPIPAEARFLTAHPLWVRALEWLRRRGYHPSYLGHGVWAMRGTRVALHEAPRNAYGGYHRVNCDVAAWNLILWPDDTWELWHPDVLHVGAGTRVSVYRRSDGQYWPGRSVERRVNTNPGRGGRRR